MNNRPNIPDYKVSEEQEACFRNERYWIEVLTTLSKDSFAMPKPIAPIKVNFIIAKQKISILLPFKSPNYTDEGYGETIGLVLIEGQAFVVNLAGKILRRSTLSIGLINLISNYYPIPDLKSYGITQKNLNIDKISSAEMDLFYEGNATINNGYRQYESIRYFLQISHLDKQTKLKLIYDWVMTLDMNNLLFESLTRDLKFSLIELPEVKLVILKAIVDKRERVSLDILNTIFRSMGDYTAVDIASLISLIIDPKNSTLFEINELHIVYLLEASIKINRGDLLMYICSYDFPWKNIFSYISFNCLFTEPIDQTNLKLIISIITSSEFAHPHLVTTLHTGIIRNWLVYYGIKDLYLPKIANLYPIANLPI